MGLFQQLRTWWFFQGTRGRRSRVYLIDTSALVTPRRGASRPSPADLVQTLQRLGRFAGKEGLTMIALADSKPLREVADGGTYEGIQVFYAERERNLDDLVLKKVRAHQGKHEVMVITANPELEERVLREGGHAMRTTTFRKALDAVLGGGDGGKGKSSSGGGRPRRSRRRRPSGHRNQQRDQGEKKGDDPVSELLDVVE